MFGHVFLRALKKRAGALLRPLGLLRVTFKATMQNTALRRDWRSVGGPLGPKWAWHSRVVHIFRKLVFSSFSRIHAIRRVLRSLWGSWASPGTLCGGPGGPTTRPRSRPLWSQLSLVFCGCGRAANRAPDRKTRGTGVPKAFVATGVCSKTFVQYEVF